MKVELLRAWPRRFERAELELPDTATVYEAVNAAGWAEDPEVIAFAVFGQRVGGDATLHDGDRVELLRSLVADPKVARRQRAEERRKLPKG